jgi:hypothetical protein
LTAGTADSNFLTHVGSIIPMDTPMFCFPFGLKLTAEQAEPHTHYFVMTQQVGVMSYYGAITVFGGVIMVLYSVLLSLRIEAYSGTSGATGARTTDNCCM